MRNAPKISGCLVVLALITAACTTSTTTTAPPAVEVHVRELPASDFEVKQQGAVSIAYELTVNNQTSAPLKLRRIEMKTVGRSPYVLRNGDVPLDQQIDPGKTATATFSMWAYPNDDAPQKAKATVWVQGTLYFEGDRGATNVRFSDSFRRGE